MNTAAVKFVRSQEGNRIRDSRYNRGMSRERLATEAGIPLAQLISIERGEADVLPELGLRIERVFAANKTTNRSRVNGKQVRPSVAPRATPVSRRASAMLEVGHALRELKLAEREVAEADVSLDYRLRDSMAAPLSRLYLAKRLIERTLARFEWQVPNVDPSTGGGTE